MKRRPRTARQRKPSSRPHRQPRRPQWYWPKVDYIADRIFPIVTVVRQADVVPVYSAVGRALWA